MVRALAAPFVVAVAVWTLGAARARDRSYWYDEAITARVVRRSLWGVVEVVTSREAGMASYFLGLFGWSQLWGSDTGLRMFSVAGAAAAAAGVWVTVRKACSPAIAGAATALVVVNPFFVRYLTEARAYSWMMAAGLAIVAVASRSSGRTDTTSSVAFGVLAGVAITLHVVMGIVVLACALATSSLRRGATVRRLSVSAGVAVVVVAPTIPVMLSRTDAQVGWIPPPSWRSLHQVVVDWLGGPVWAVLVGLGLCALVAALAMGWRRERWLVAIAAAAIATPAVTFAVSFVQSLWLDRYLAGALPLAVVGAVVGWQTLLERLVPSRVVAGAALALTATVVAVFLAGNPLRDDVPLDGWDDAARFVEVTSGAGDALVLRAHDAAIDHYLGFRPDLESALVELPGDGDVYPVRLPIEQVDPLLPRDASVFVVTTDDFGFDLAELPSLAGRNMDVHEFGHALVRVFGPAEG